MYQLQARLVLYESVPNMEAFAETNRGRFEEKAKAAVQEAEEAERRERQAQEDGEDQALEEAMAISNLFADCALSEADVAKLRSQLGTWKCSSLLQTARDLGVRQAALN